MATPAAGDAADDDAADDDAAAALAATALLPDPARSRLDQGVNAHGAREFTGVPRAVAADGMAATGAVGATESRVGVRIAADREARRCAEGLVADVDCCAAGDP
ncbi:MAG: hypothetical protein ACOYO2_04530 [Mycobacterium sp.]